MQHSEIWILDFDRTLGNAVLYAHAERALERLSPEAKDRIVAARAEVEGDGGTFDMIAYLEKNDRDLREEFLRVFDEVTSANDPETYRNAGATDLLDYLNSQKIPYMIMTYGGQAWQEAKLKAAQLHMVPHIVVDSKLKGEQIHSWYRPESKEFAVPFPGGPSQRALSICLVDDKAQAFTGLPGNARGYWLQAREMLESQRGEAPVFVATVSTLADIVRLEKM